MKKRSAILFLALLLFVGLWFFWPVLSSRLGWEKKRPLPEKPATPPKEKLFEDDRRRLDEVLKQRQSK
jgi:type VI protein secretion system component VasK